jgi:hypothetical protein
MKQIVKNVYSYAELIEQSKTGLVGSAAVERVRTKLSEWVTSDNWYDSEYEVWQSALEQIGFTRPEIRFSGFWSQGDGASFTSEVDVERLFWYSTHKIVGRNIIKPTKRTGSDEDFLPWVVHQLGGQYGYFPKIRKLKNKLLDGCLRLSVEREYGVHYVHERSTKLVSEDYGFSDKELAIVGEWIGEIESLRYRLCQSIYSNLEREYEYLTCDEHLIDFDLANTYQWDCNGNLE